MAKTRIRADGKKYQLCRKYAACCRRPLCGTCKHSHTSVRRRRRPERVCEHSIRRSVATTWHQGNLYYQLSERVCRWIDSPVSLSRSLSIAIYAGTSCRRKLEATDETGGPMAERHSAMCYFVFVHKPVWFLCGRRLWGNSQPTDTTRPHRRAECVIM